MTDEEMPAAYFTLVAAPLHEMHSRQLRLNIDLNERTWEALHVRGGRDATGVVQVEESREGGLHVIEALLPLEELGVKPGADVEIALPIFYDTPEGWHINPSYYTGRRSQGNFLRSSRRYRTVARLRLAERASPPRRVDFSAHGPSPLAVFAVDEEPFTGEWSSAVRLTDERFTAELTIPWSDIERFGLDRNALVVNFDPSPPTDDNIQELQRFDAQSRTFHLDDSPLEARRYNVRLHFAELDEEVGPGDRVFDVSLQGETVLEGLDVLVEAGEHRRALVREFRDVEAKRALEVAFTPRTGELTQTSAPILSGLEIEEEVLP